MNNRMDMAYDDLGSGPAIIFLHGYPFNRSMWREQIEFFSAEGFRAIAPDLRGLGETKPTAEITTIEEMARDVAALMDELKVAHAAICGLSMGSYVTLEFMHQFPGRVQALILAGARAQAADAAEKKSREQQAERVLLEGLSFVLEAMLPKLLAHRTLNEKPEVVGRVRQMILQTDPRGAAAAQRAMAARHDYAKDLATIKAPTLVISGREDSIRPPGDAEFLHRGIRNSRLEIIDDAGHLMNMEQPKVFNQSMIEFLRLIH